jgi:ribosome-binding protein aMBF1 (putative translation factor)
VAYVVAWFLTRDVPCDRCGNAATVEVTEDGVNTLALCNDCKEAGTQDPIAEVFARAREAQREREQPRGD